VEQDHDLDFAESVSSVLEQEKVQTTSALVSKHSSLLLIDRSECTRSCCFRGFKERQL